MTTSECVSLRIREVLNKKQMTIYKLEQISCISHSTMKALLNNVNNSCNLKTLFLIIQSLEMTVLDFFNSPLFEDLYNEGLITKGLAGEFSSEEDYAFSAISGETKNVDEVVGRINNRINEMKTNGLDKEEFERTKKMLYGRFVRGFEEIGRAHV